MTVLIGGCTVPGIPEGVGGGGGAITGTGLVITDFSPDFSSVRSGDSLELYLEVENRGQAPAVGPFAYLYGINMDDWGSDDSDRVHYLANDLSGTLEPPDENLGVPGEVSDTSWSLTAPDVDPGIKSTYEPRVRVFYKYTNGATARIPLISESEADRMRSAGEALPSSVDIITTAGPIGVEVTARAPVIIKSGSDNSFRTIVRLTNLMGGSPYNPDKHGDTEIGQDDLNIVRATLSVSSGTIDCGDGPDTSFTKDVSLRRGTGTVSCDIDPPDTVATREDMTLKVELEYGYMVDSVTSIEVTG
ncbi:MAG: hypothetical protein DRP11_04110 [Candidatus Aenigmatarchaeota archaeon]|nr:MAG: hypothetical protein DRP11_04110 [Candidatus Aenigmarchaeota archaeon]